MKTLNELPKSVQKEIKETLKAYSEVPVTYENGRYSFSLCLKSEYADDHEFIGTFYAKDIYTPEERIINYFESFHEYPISYKGKRDYKMLRDLEAERNNMSCEEFWAIRFKLDSNGDIVRA